MAKNTDRVSTKKNQGARQEKTKIYVDELYFRHVDQAERWRRESEHYQAVENKLLEVSQFSYEEFDYTPLMVRNIFKERVVPDYSYMLKDAQVAAESQFFIPIIARGILLIVAAFILIVGTNSIVLWMSGASVLALLILLFLLIQERHLYIERTLLEKQTEIDNRVAYEKKKIADEREQHEKDENERIKIIEDLFSGEISSVFAKIENVLDQLNFFFDTSVEIDLYHNIPSIKVWFPPKTIIPNITCVVQSSGRPTFTEKEMRVINKQYLELCAGILIKIMSVIYAHIPVFQTAYIYGMSRESGNAECFIESKAERESLIMACSATTGLEGLQILKANFKCNTSLELLPLVVEDPEEWNKVERKLVRRLQVNLSRP
ncbi:hypothetical protein [Pelosinus sp. sgz500959]|uniref:hypothetical protein n=1 Tax=Pelosinus sp. sgz500959 TaxID=3242472 RepID=UPI0036707BBE